MSYASFAKKVIPLAHSVKPSPKGIEPGSIVYYESQWGNGKTFGRVSRIDSSKHSWMTQPQVWGYWISFYNLGHDSSVWMPFDRVHLHTGPLPPGIVFP